MRRRLILAILAWAVLSSAWAGPRPAWTRPANDEAWRLIETGLTRSETIRRLVQRLEQSDLIAFVEVGHVTPPALGDTRIVAASGAARYLRVRGTTRALPADQLMILGHELCHAAEIADAPEVRDSGGQSALGQWRKPAPAPPVTHINLIQSWFDELKAKVPPDPDRHHAER